MTASPTPEPTAETEETSAAEATPPSATTEAAEPTSTSPSSDADDRSDVTVYAQI